MTDNNDLTNTHNRKAGHKCRRLNTLQFEYLVLGFL